jgi:polysaccharide biosynthesis protein PelE
MAKTSKDVQLHAELTEEAHEELMDVVHLSVLAEFFIIGVLTMVAEIGVYILFLQDAISFIFSFVLHMIVVGLLSLWVWKRFHIHSGIRISILLHMSTLFLGPFGAIGSVLSVFTYYFFQKTSHSFIEWYNEIFPEEIVIPSHELHLSILAGRERPEESASVSSFNDIMATGDTEQKQAVIQIITQNFRPEFSVAIHQALRDKDPVIRVQASSCVSTIERRFNNRIQDLTEKFRENPNSFVVCAALAHVLDDYAHSGLLDNKRIKEVIQRALFYYLEAVELKHDDFEVCISIGRIILKQKRYKEAKVWFGKIMKDGLESPIIYGWYIETLFYLKEYAELRKFVVEHKEILSDQSLHENVKQFAALWMDESVVQGSAV